MKFLGVLFILSLILVACSGAECSSPPCTMPEPAEPDESTFVIALAFSETLRGLQAAASGAPGTTIYENGKYMVFIWQQGGYPAFAILNSFAWTPVEDFVLEAGGNGAMTDIKSMGELVSFLKETGWKYVPKDQIPAWVADSVGGASAVNALGAPYMPTFIFLPVGEDPLDYIDSVEPVRIIQ